MKKMLLILILSTFLVGCASITDTEKQQLAANASLVSAGLITNKMAMDMASDDANKIQQLITTSQPQTNQTWKNQVTHDAYQYTSLDISVNAEGQPCRTYQIKALLGRHDQQLQVKACRQNDGTWQAVNNSTPTS